MSDASPEPEESSGPDTSPSSAPSDLERPADEIGDRPLHTARAALRAMLAADGSGHSPSGPSPAGTDDASEA